MNIIQWLYIDSIINIQFHVTLKLNGNEMR